MEKLNRAAKCSILGPQNLGSGGGGPGPPGPPLDPRLPEFTEFIESSAPFRKNSIVGIYLFLISSLASGHLSDGLLWFS